MNVRDMVRFIFIREYAVYSNHVSNCAEEAQMKTATRSAKIE